MILNVNKTVYTILQKIVREVCQSNLCFQLGPVYTLYVVGERLTFVTEPEDFGYFFNSSDVDFQHAVQDAVMNIGQYRFITMLHSVLNQINDFLSNKTVKVNLLKFRTLFFFLFLFSNKFSGLEFLQNASQNSKHRIP